MLTNVFFATIVHISKRLFKRIQQENNEQRVHDIIKHVPLIPDTGKSVLMFLPVTSCSLYQQLYYYNYANWESGKTENKYIKLSNSPKDVS